MGSEMCIRDSSCASPFSRGDLDVGRVAALVSEMENEANKTLGAEGIPTDRRRLVHALDLRYAGQYHEVRIDDVDRQSILDIDIVRISALFHAAHDGLYGYNLGDTETVIELVNLRLTAYGITDKPALTFASATGAPARKGSRPIYLPDAEAFAEVPVFDGEALEPGVSTHGPAIIETAVTTTVLPDGFALEVDDLGTLVMSGDGT